MPLLQDMDANISITEKSLPLIKGVDISVVHHHFSLMDPKNRLGVPEFKLLCCSLNHLNGLMVSVLKTVFEFLSAFGCKEEMSPLDLKQVFSFSRVCCHR